MRLHTILVICSLPALLLSGCLAAAPKAPSPAATAEQRGAGQFMSYVNIPCDKVTASLQNKESRNNVLLVISGFMSGTNYLKGRNVNVEINSMAKGVETYCQNNPKESLANALVELDRAIDQINSKQHLVQPSGTKPQATAKPAVAAPVKGPQVPNGSTVAVASGPAVVAPRPVEAPRTNVALPTPTKSSLPPVAAPPASTIASGDYIVQVISTTDVEEANRVASKLHLAGIPSTVERVSFGDKGIWYRVIAGPYANQNAAKEAADALTAAKYTSVIVRKR